MNPMQPHHCLAQAKPFRAQGGFTLLELLIVALVLAALGGGVIAALGDTQAHAMQQTALAEMQKIKTALLQYRRDTGEFPAPVHPADFSALYQQGGAPAWDAPSARGWRGPYLSVLGEGLVDIGDSLQNDGGGSPVLVVSAAHAEARAVADPFVARAVKNGSTSPCTDDASDSACLLDFRTQAGDPRHPHWGRPYLLFELNDPARARLVSMGPDGVYGGPPGSDPCTPPAGADDFVLCLAR